MTQAFDERAIKQVLLKWCRAIDRLDLQSIRALFHPDAIDDHVFYHGGIEGLITALAQRHSHIPFSSHLLGNVLIEFANSDVALVETYVHVTQHLKNERGAKVVQTSWCRYIDRFELRGNAIWRIAHRLLVIDSAVEAPLTSPEVFSALPANRGRRDAHDPIFIARNALGMAGTSE